MATRTWTMVTAILRAMSVQASERFQTMGEFRQALLAGNVSGKVVNAEAAASVQPQQKPVQQRIFTAPIQPQPVVQPQPAVQPQQMQQPQSIVQPSPVQQSQSMRQSQPVVQLQQMPQMQVPPTSGKPAQNTKIPQIGFWIGIICLVVGLACMVAYITWPEGRSEAAPVGIVLIILGVIVMVVSKIISGRTKP